jgi:hypothetical protein
LKVYVVKLCHTRKQTWFFFPLFLICLESIPAFQRKSNCQSLSFKNKMWFSVNNDFFLFNSRGFMFDFDLFFNNEMKVRKITLHAFIHLEGFRLNDVRMKKRTPKSQGIYFPWTKLNILKRAILFFHKNHF